MDRAEFAANEHPLQPTPEEAKDLIPLQVPAYWASMFHTNVVGNDAILLVSTPRLSVSRSTGAPTRWAMQQPVCALQMSMSAIKELSTLLGDLVARFESENGEILAVSKLGEAKE